MLVLTRKSGQGIKIGDDIRVVVLEVKEGQIRLGIEASQDTRIYRDEIYQRIQDQNKLAAAPISDDFLSGITPTEKSDD